MYCQLNEIDKQILSPKQVKCIEELDSKGFTTKYIIELLDNKDIADSFNLSSDDIENLKAYIELVILPIEIELVL